MTANEHKLVMYMLARQRTLFTSLVELLRSRGIMQADDLEAFQSLAEEASYEQKDFENIRTEYQSFAEGLGVSL